MPETPRTWTMRQTSERGVGWLVNGSMPEPFETVEVVEKAPMLAALQAAQKRATDARQDHKEALAELERTLDLLEAAKREIECPEDSLRVGIPVYAKIRQCLREHGRLGGTADA